MGRRKKLTLEMSKTIVGYILAGAFDYVAAQAVGITPQTFQRWMKRGEKNTEEPFRSFYYRVRQARAEARVIAENKVFADAPFNWLRYGPGRERPGEPGWTDSKQVELSTKDNKPLGITHYFDQALKRAYSDNGDDSIGEISDDGSGSELPARPDQELPAG